MIYLSICIPTYKRIDITRKTIASIYSDLEGVNIREFEVVVSDNDPMQSSKCFIEEFIFPNFKYYATDCEGFLNSYYSLGYGRGKYLKLHNNYTMLKAGTLRFLIDEVKRNALTKTEMFFTNGELGIRSIRKYISFDSYMYDLNYFSSWSAGFGIWKEDYDKIKGSVEINKMFPQTSLLLFGSDKGAYILNDESLFEDQKIPRKGGYNPYKVFGIDYLNLLKKVLFSGKISINTYMKIKNAVLVEYLSSRYFKSAIAKMDNFEYADAKQYLSIEYGKYTYYRMLIHSLLFPIKYIFKK